MRPSPSAAVAARICALVATSPAHNAREIWFRSTPARRISHSTRSSSVTNVRACANDNPGAVGEGLSVIGEADTADSTNNLGTLTPAAAARTVNSTASA
ncbi:MULTISPECIES: hypothetical protein [Actinoalloteichus]|uniref:Uncharacterized protein n=1 Tax=Actinoalloteichus fjordicus TaxID=1612552 RepID=A0AAC9LEL0_9PSEU|nr:MULTISPECIES: hypothetical protein [Actinoalloteichus]APU15317.1 hypothetical protein UA74_16365 [Actinoalloteichus fjordicus]APU21386.1 hypothetical protein UA75_16910 [Actinoalloteichus sp. GBA129-24]